jgi:hypothetical protein
MATLQRISGLSSLITLLLYFQVAAAASPLKSVWRIFKGCRSRLERRSIDNLSRNIMPAPPLGPFFHGWFTRVLDSRQNISVVVICGEYCEDGIPRQTYMHASVNGGPDAYMSSSAVDNSSACTSENKHYRNSLGFVVVEDNCTKINLSNDKFELRLTTSGRVPWTTDTGTIGGPEGWLGYSGLLPCRYSVHSLGSEGCFVLRRKGSGEELLRGSGLAHLESNQGSSFPAGWVWAQGFGTQAGDSLVVVGGDFMVGSLCIRTWILRVSYSGRVWIMRSTDFDRIAYRTDPYHGRVQLTAVSRSGKLKVVVDICSRKPCASFESPPLFVPTRRGFSNSPGCRETYTATARVAVFEYEGDKFVQKKMIEYINVALEFGAKYQHQIVSSPS